MVNMANVSSYSTRGVYAGRLNAALEMLKESSPRVLLDIGCRDFGLQEKFYKYSKKVYVADVDYDVLPSSVRRNVFAVNADGCKLPFRPESFDGVLLAEVIEHVPDTFDMLKECSRVLKDNGYLILTTPNKDRIASYIRKLTGKEYKLPYQVHEGPGGWHVREYAKKELENDLNNSGFKVISWKSTFFGISFSDKIPIGTIKHAGRFLKYNATLAVLAQKVKRYNEG